MDNPSALIEHDLFLTFNNCPIRVIMFDGVPWFVVPDLCAAMGVYPKFAAKVNNPAFPPSAKRTCSEVTEEGLQDIVLVSPVGAWWLTALVDPARGQGLAAWTRREAQRLCPEPRPGDPAMFLTVGADGSLPPRPFRYSGRKAEWEDLRHSQEYFNSQMARATERKDLQARLLTEAEAARLAALKAPEGSEVAA
ncbi:hypothetical protein [Sphingobium sp. B12D2B]|uniref:hypothetical protein n=1 Tax=Sphingobium sp. B12D2B TaxID=2940577 RepID=UPI00222551B1|nr:hypothetical protein [Sphingobium sp. B12D2B]MCW2349804.1 hypothetical protein [Sphingobium sp. B12D2B]